MRIIGKSAPSPPPAPDYAAAATAQGVANKESGISSASISNPNIYSPYGNQTVSYAPTGPDGNQQPTITQSLTPEAQQTLDAQQRVQYGLAQLGQQGLGTAQDVLGQRFQSTAPNLQTSVGQTGLDYGPAPGQYGQAQGFDPSAYGQAGSTDAAAYGQARDYAPGQFGQAQSFNSNAYGQARGVGAGPSAQNTLDLSGVAKMPVNAGMTGQNAILSRLQPQITQNENATRQRLANQGLAAGGEAYDNEMRNQNNQENDLYTQAALQGIGLDTAANAQGYNQAMSSAGLYNTAIGQNFGQNLQAQTARNAAVAQNYGQGFSANAANNAAQQQNYGQSAAAIAAQNAAVGQNYGQGVTSQQQQNAAIAQNAGLGLSGVQAGNQAVAQNYGQGASSAGLYNQAAAQGYNQNLQGAQFGNQAALQQYQQQLAQYNQPLNQITALMSGSQIQNPQFQQYTGQNIQPAPIANATQLQGQYAQNVYGQQMAGYNSQMGALGGLFGGLGTVAGGFFGG